MPRPKSANPTRPISVRLPVPLVEWLEAEAEKRHLTVTAIVATLIVRAGGPVDGGDDLTHGLKADQMIPSRGAKRGAPMADHEHVWANHGWGTICEICKVRRTV